jgi:hypothetical protein
MDIAPLHFSFSVIASSETQGLAHGVYCFCEELLPESPIALVLC